MNEERPRGLRIQFTKDRLEALVDGIFGFAMTLLVVDLAIPRGLSPEELSSTFFGQLHNFYTYALSFLLLASFWVGHHRQFHHIKGVDHRLLWINIVMLLFVALMPFSTSLLANYHESEIAGLFFGANILVLGVVLAAGWIYARMHHLFADDIEKKVIYNNLRRALLAPAVAVVVMVVSLFDAQYSNYIYIIILILLFTPPFRPM